MTNYLDWYIATLLGFSVFVPANHKFSKFVKELQVNFFYYIFPKMCVNRTIKCVWPYMVNHETIYMHKQNTKNRGAITLSDGVLGKIT